MEDFTFFELKNKMYLYITFLEEGNSSRSVYEINHLSVIRINIYKANHRWISILNIWIHFYNTKHEKYIHISQKYFFYT